MKKVIYTLLFLICLFANKLYSQELISIDIKNIEWNENKATINFDIVEHEKSEFFYVWIELYDEKGSKLFVREEEGDIYYGISAGTNKQITFSITENIADKQKIKINIYAETQKQALSFSESKKIDVVLPLAKSIICPGWGNYSLQRKPANFLVGVVAHSCLISSIILRKHADNQYNNYLAATEITSRNDYYKQFDKSHNASRILLTSAAIIWVVELGRTYLNIKSLQKKNFGVSYSFNTQNAQPELCFYYRF